MIHLESYKHYNFLSIDYSRISHTYTFQNMAHNTKFSEILKSTKLNTLKESGNSVLM